MKIIGRCSHTWVKKLDRQTLQPALWWVSANICGDVSIFVVSDRQVVVVIQILFACSLFPFTHVWHVLQKGEVPCVEVLGRIFCSAFTDTFSFDIQHHMTTNMQRGEDCHGNWSKDDDNLDKNRKPVFRLIQVNLTSVWLAVGIDILSGLHFFSTVFPWR